MPTSRKMTQKAQELQVQFDVLHEKIARLRKAVAIETDPTLKLKFEKQLEEAEAEREQIDRELQQLEQQQETWKAVSVQPDIPEPPSYLNTGLSEPVFEKTRKIASETQVFICYAREDHEVAKKLYKDLKRVGVTPWLDTEDILPGQNWKVTTQKALRASSYILVLLSSHSVSKRGFVQKEIKMALDILDEFPPDEIFIIPVRLDDCEPADERLQDLQWVEFSSSYEIGLNQILRVLLPNQNEKQIQQIIQTPSQKPLSELAKSLFREIKQDTQEDLKGLL
jgi:hypothetical protein